jgi:CHASE1-domain containing sensor protein
MDNIITFGIQFFNFLGTPQMAGSLLVSVTLWKAMERQTQKINANFDAAIAKQTADLEKKLDAAHGG